MEKMTLTREKQIVETLPKIKISFSHYISIRIINKTEKKAPKN